MEYRTEGIKTGSAYRWIRNESERCVVVFSSFALRDYGAEAFSFRAFFEEHSSSADFLFIKDIANQWYNRRLDGLGNGIDETTHSLEKILGNYNHTTCFGSSMGAYASLLFGARLDVDHIVAVSPQTFLSAPFPRHNRDRHKGTFSDLRALHHPGKRLVDIVVGEDNLFDIYQAIPYLDRPRTRVSIAPGEYHVVVDHWNEIGLLPSIAESICKGAGEATLQTIKDEYDQATVLPAALCTDRFRLNVITAVESFYVGRYREAIDALEDALQVAVDWLGAKVMLAECHFRLGDLPEAISLFEYVSRKSSRIDDFYPVFAEALALSDQPEKAIDAAARGALLNRGMRRSFDIIADIFETKGLIAVANHSRARARL